MLDKFGTQSIKINISDDIQSRSAGVMGDLNSRVIKFTIIAEDGEVLDDNSIKVSLVCRTQKNELIFTEGKYLMNGQYSVPFANEVYEEEQDLLCVIRLERGSGRSKEIIHSNSFVRHVLKGLVGTEREGKTTIIDLVKVMEFGDSFNEKMELLNNTATEKNNMLIETHRVKTEEYNSNHSEKLKIYNDNDRVKTEIYNNNHDDKVSKYDENHEFRLGVYNSNHAEKLKICNDNAENKTNLYNKNHTDKVKIYNDNAENQYNKVNEKADEVTHNTNTSINTLNDIKEIKEDIDHKYTVVNEVYANEDGRIEAEKKRVESEKLRAEHDERLQRVFNEGLESELGNYAKKADMESFKSQVNQEVTGFINSSEKKNDTFKTSINNSLQEYVLKSMLTFSEGNKKYIAVFKVINGDPVIEKIEVS